MASCVSRAGGEQDGVGELDTGGGGPPGSRASGSAGWRTPATATEAAGGGRGLSVTPHAQISGEHPWRVLLVGVDSLDLGLYVEWGPDFERLLAVLEEGKAKAAGKEGISFRSRAGVGLILPSGKPPMFRFGLRYPEFLIWIGKSRVAGNSPNVYVSLDCLTLRASGVVGAVALPVRFVEKLGGKVHYVKPSRFDLAVDLHIPGGLSNGFLEAYRVGRSEKLDIHKVGALMETFYIGERGSPIMLRIYDKSKEIVASGKEWFKELWKYDGPDVWRVEYQLRREVLQQFRIASVEDLLDKLGGIWKYLTEDWCSLREPDSENASRRTVYAPWRSVQECASDFGQVVAVERDLTSETPAALVFHVARGAGAMVSYAARRGLDSREAAAQAFIAAIFDYVSEREFREKYIVRAIRYGRGIAPGDRGHVEETA